MNPPLSMVGTTATHCAEPRTSSGIPWSGADSISSRTVLAALIRSSALFLSSSSAAKVGRAKQATRHRIRSRFISSYTFGRLIDLEHDESILPDFAQERP